MEKKNNNFIKPLNEADSSKTRQEPFFSKESITNTAQKGKEAYSKSELNRIKVFRHIEANEPMSSYKIHKELEMAYNTVSYIVRDLIFAGLVHERVIINENNVAVKLLTIPKEKEGADV